MLLPFLAQGFLYLPHLSQHGSCMTRLLPGKGRGQLTSLHQVQLSRHSRIRPVIHDAALSSGDDARVGLLFIGWLKSAALVTKRAQKLPVL